MEQGKTEKNEEIACTKSGKSSFTSAMLCFLQGFSDRDEKNPSRDQKTFRFRLLRKSRASLKLLSTSSPAMTSQMTQIIAPPSPKPEKKEEDTPTASKSRQKKFHRHFPSVESEENVLNYYSCALISDILLQGHLYITKNYFAFYSNVFGYVTKLLIPMPTVEKITKEKTARIIPNAVGISTAEDKHVFGSLISRENTYKYMIKVWELSQKAMEEAAAEAEALVVPEALEIPATESDSSETKDIESEKESCLLTSNARLNDIKSIFDRYQQHNQANSNIKHRLFQKYRNISNLPTQSMILYAAIFLLIGLSISATLILYRISKIHDEYVTLIEHHDPSLSSDNVYNQLLRFSIHLHSKSANSMHNFIDSNLHQIAKVRQNLELLSTLLMPKDSLHDAKESQEGDLVNPKKGSRYHQEAVVDNEAVLKEDNS